jgi:exopolysaccharide biosynthesis WecB/TagA/CpsF family protein
MYKIYEELFDGKLITFLNPYSLWVLHKKALLQTVCDKFDYIFIDGIALVKAINIKYNKDFERKSFDMTSLAPLVFEYAIKNDKTLYLIGTKKGVIEKSISNLKSIYPNLSIIGYRHGYFETEEEYSKILEDISKLNPDIVIVGMGTPLQELFLIDLKKVGWNGTGFTCGGFLEQTAQHINYYPEIMDKLHLRWLYRLYKEPKRLFKRYSIIYPKSLLTLLLGKIEICLDKIK